MAREPLTFNKKKPNTNDNAQPPMPVVSAGPGSGKSDPLALVKLSADVPRYLTKLLAQEALDRDINKKDVLREILEAHFKERGNG